MGIECALCQYSLGGTDGAKVSGNQGCAVCHAGASLVGCLGLVWAKVLGLPEAVGQQGCLYPFPISSVSVCMWGGDLNHGIH